MNTPDRNILTNAMLVELDTSFWTAHRRDRDVSAVAADQYRAVPFDAGFFNKRLLSKEALARLRTCHRNARDQHNHHTLPWSKNGIRLLTVDNYDTYVKTIDSLREQLLAEINVLKHDYARWRADARTKLSAMYRDSDYPDPDELNEKFSLTYTMSPIPASHHFLVALNGDRDRVRNQIDTETQKRVRDAASALYSRINDALEHFSQRMGTDTQGKPLRFKDTTLTKLTEIVKVAPRLNLYNDPELNRLCAQLEQRLNPIDPDTLRPTSAHFNPALRTELHLETQALAEKFAGYYAVPKTTPPTGLHAPSSAAPPPA